MEGRRVEDDLLQAMDQDLMTAKSSHSEGWITTTIFGIISILGIIIIVISGGSIYFIKHKYYQKEEANIEEPGVDLQSLQQETIELRRKLQDLSERIARMETLLKQDSKFRKGLQEAE